MNQFFTGFIFIIIVSAVYFVISFFLAQPQITILTWASYVSFGMGVLFVFVLCHYISFYATNYKED
jgi:hypothetical protein